MRNQHAVSADGQRSFVSGSLAADHRRQQLDGGTEELRNFLVFPKTSAADFFILRHALGNFV
jgi:hypothetical protein